MLAGWLRNLARNSLVGTVQEEQIRYCRDATNTRATAEIVGMNRNLGLWEVVWEARAAETSKLMAGKIEIDKSYFGDVH